jgi:hypothetical protein
MASRYDLLRPPEVASVQVLRLSQSTWHASLSSARAAAYLPYRCSRIRSLLNHTPSIPESTQVTEIVRNDSIFLEGYAT